MLVGTWFDDFLVNTTAVVAVRARFLLATAVLLNSLAKYWEILSTNLRSFTRRVSKMEIEASIELGIRCAYFTCSLFTLSSFRRSPPLQTFQSKMSALTSTAYR